jgi:hypothetical protein
MYSTSDTNFRELDRRRSNGIEVALFWNSVTNQVFVSVADERDGICFEFEVEQRDAMYAFHHPYAYAEFATEPHAMAA